MNRYRNYNLITNDLTFYTDLEVEIAINIVLDTIGYRYVDMM